MQKVVRLNLKETNDFDRLDELLEKSDLLLTSTHPAALARLGLG
jgi:alpha-methylacyl-CoA racemase